MQAHPLAMLMPDMAPDERIELQRDIGKFGLRHPIILYKGMILDGRHRYAACRELGVTPRTEEFRGDDAAAASLVVSLNLHRRHLSRDQKRDLVQALLKVDPQASDRAIAKIAKVDHKTVAAARVDAEDGGEFPHHARRVGADGVSQPTEKKLVKKKSGTETIPAAKAETDLAALVREVQETTEQRNELADVARELNDKLAAYEKTDPDEQQQQILKLQKRIVRLETEIARLTRARNDAQAKNNELICEVKRLRRQAAA